MRISSAKAIGGDGWTGRAYELIPETTGVPAQTLRLEVADEYAHWISDRMEAPVLAALFPAMALNEPIRIEQPLSEKFHYNLRQVAKYFHLWYPSRLSMPQIECGGTDRVHRVGSAVCGCFSGGVDSFYTLLQHLPEAEPLDAYRLSHGMFVHGLDIVQQDAAFFERLAGEYGALLGGLHMSLVRCRTNMRPIVEPQVDWMTAHGAALLMMAHFLSNGIGRFLIPSTNRYSLINPPIGSNPVTDPQAVTESLEAIHHGCEASRIEKILALSDWPLAQKHLRVCFQSIEAGINCGRCPKCQKVMMPLWLTGKLDRFACFPSGFDPKTVDPHCWAPLELERYAPEKSYAEELAELGNRSNPERLRRIPIPAIGRKPGLLQRLWSALQPT